MGLNVVDIDVFYSAATDFCIFDTFFTFCDVFFNIFERFFSLRTA